MNKLRFLKNVDSVKLREWLLENNGHGIRKPSFFTDMGFPESFVQRFTRIHRSVRGDFKETIFLPDGTIAKKLRGVFDLDFVRGLAYELKADTRKADSKIGRAFAAAEYGKACITVLDDVAVIERTDSHEDWDKVAPVRASDEKSDVGR